ncbi:uncharacterized protein LOC111245784 isoform X1 [Varroa destructor]|uniref:Uncharacterized protein n=1 Tax=Varroa destructor TaxID=109461 RepID=A0A7M7JP89_VARDE|nr:uncharacterized protein LOC111245784 isoform X1 [Varroa destructor]
MIQDAAYWGRSLVVNAAKTCFTSEVRVNHVQYYSIVSAKADSGETEIRGIVIRFIIMVPTKCLKHLNETFVQRNSESGMEPSFYEPNDIRGCFKCAREIKIYHAIRRTSPPSLGHLVIPEQEQRWIYDIWSVPFRIRRQLQLTTEILWAQIYTDKSTPSPPVLSKRRPFYQNL